MHHIFDIVANDAFVSRYVKAVTEKKKIEKIMEERKEGQKNVYFCLLLVEFANSLSKKKRAFFGTPIYMYSGFA